MESQKVVLITGGSSGLGKTTGIYLAKKGFKVYGTSRNPESYPDFNHFPLLEMDVRKSDSIANALNSLIAAEGRIDVLINNAGVGITGPLEETPEEAIADNFEVNFYGPLRVIRETLPKMRAMNSGFIINITSIAAYMGLPYRGIYSASKSALEVSTEAYRMELKGSGIQMCTLAPGDYATNIASGRYHTPVLEGSPYAEPYGKTLDLINAHVDSGKDPEEVAEKIYTILKKSYPSVHYTVGSPMQRLSLILKRLLPDKLYERLLLNHYKL
jgi:short-subunit dehydrogenase